MAVNRHAVELAQKILEVACRGESAVDFDDLSAATIRSLSLITSGDAIEFCEKKQPPFEVTVWLQDADLPEVQGLLFETLYRWHELRLAR